MVDIGSCEGNVSLMRLMPTHSPRPIFYKNSERFLVAKLLAGWELVGRCYRRGDFIECERPDVIAYCIESGSVEQTSAKPDTFKLTERGRRLLGT